MNTFTKSALTLLAASSIASVALAAPGDSTYGNITRAQAQVNTLESQLSSMGATADMSVGTNAAIAPTEKAALLNERASDLQLQINELKSQRSE